ncbi:hypothetical protein ACIPL1_21135 [Pseudomonas sp. NPDC090202]|uniref:hypothetical protein n=1 Tax=unclassified Pseudomonas TaxID=196821 RepID=UPI00382B0F0C
MEPLDYSDVQAVREVLVKWYGQQANAWDINEAVIRLIIKMLEEMHNCTAAMRLVPTPTTFGGQMGQLAKGYIKNMIGALRKHSDVYKTCSKAVIYKYKTFLAEAAAGV